jgi:hypothetical protein
MQRLIEQLATTFTKATLPTGCVVEFCCAAQRVNQFRETVRAWRGGHESDFDFEIILIRLRMNQDQVFADVRE